MSVTCAAGLFGKVSIRQRWRRRTLLKAWRRISASATLAMLVPFSLAQRW
jgi:hypothetical protein